MPTGEAWTKVITEIATLKRELDGLFVSLNVCTDRGKVLQNLAAKKAEIEALMIPYAALAEKAKWEKQFYPEYGPLLENMPERVKGVEQELHELYAKYQQCSSSRDAASFKAKIRHLIRKLTALIEVYEKVQREQEMA